MLHFLSLNTLMRYVPPMLSLTLKTIYNFRGNSQTSHQTTLQINELIVNATPLM